MCPFDYMVVRLVGREGLLPVNPFNHTRWMAVVTPTDHSKSVCNRCVIEFFGGVLCCDVAFLDFFGGVGTLP